MKKSKVIILLACLLFTLTMMSVHANIDSETCKKEITIVQPKFTNITVFANDFYITDQGKAVLTSSVDARNVDEITISMYLQKYQDGRWNTVKHWVTTQRGTLCIIGKTWYVVRGYQYRMLSCVYQDGRLIESTSYASKSLIY
ncbi:hypothetical protein JYU11_01320 [bacterium AH-315-G05]|nr:hypothetical protein [bacterium AH-315-G05]